MDRNPITQEKAISVITPTQGRVHLIGRLLASLYEARSSFRGESEVIIIDSSALQEAGKIQELCSRYDAKYVRGSKSVREKRNLGIKKARFDIILCIDSDCEADEGLLNQHLVTYEQYPEIAGCVGITRFRGDRTWIWKMLEFTPFLDSFRFAEKYPYVMWAPCSNLSFRKHAVESIGMFRTDWPFKLGGDDLDLSLRLTEAGFLIKSNERAIVYHTTETWNRLQSVLERIWRWGRMNFHIAQSHPYLLTHDIPRFPVIFAFVVAIALLSIPMHPLIGLALPVIAILVFLLIYTIVVFMMLGLRWSSSPYVLVSRALLVLFEFGRIYESVKYKDINLLFKRIIFSQDEITNGWGKEIVYAWALLLTLAICVGILLLTV